MRCIGLQKQFRLAKEYKPGWVTALTQITQMAYYPASWYSFCRPQKDDRLSQPTWYYFNEMTGAQTQDLQILSQPTSGMLCNVLFFFADTYEYDDLSHVTFHASHQPRITRAPAITALLPLFTESAQSHAMILQCHESDR